MDVADGFSDVCLLASGGYGKVFTANEERWEGKKKTAREVVIKAMTSLNHGYVRMSAFREIFILRRLQSSAHIVRLISSFAFVDQPSGDVTGIHLTLERMDMDVAFLLRQAKRGRNELGVRWSDAEWSENGRFVVQQLLCALRDVHSINALHRDVKPGNVLVKVNSEGRPYQVKLADFGLARPLDTSYSHEGYLTHAVSTRWYRAPEILLGKSSYTSAVDIWSVGCVMAEFLLRGLTLFPGSNDTDQLQRICHMLGVSQVNQELQAASNETAETFSSDMGNVRYETENLRQMLPPHITQQEFSLLQSLLQFDGAKRPSAAEALKHPYFSSLDSSDSSAHSFGGRPLHIEDESLCLMAKSQKGLLDALSYMDVEFRCSSARNQPRSPFSAPDTWTSWESDSESGTDASESVFTSSALKT